MPAGDMPAGARGQAFQYPAGELITSSLSNKGNATAFGRDNTFRVLEQNAIRIIDDKGNLLFSGTGPEAARQAVEIGKNLSDTLGNKAGWTIQTGERTINPDGSVGGMRYYDVANEKVNKSTLDKIANVAGTVLPLAMIPLTMGASAPLAGLGAAGNVALGAGVGAASAGLRGQDILKGAVMGGLTSAGGQFLSTPLKGAGLSADVARAVGTGIGTTAGGVVTGQPLDKALMSGLVSGGTTYLGSKLLGPSPEEIEFQRGMNKLNADLMGDIEAYNIDAGDAFRSTYAPEGGGLTSGGGTPSYSSPNIVATANVPTAATPSFAVNLPSVAGTSSPEIVATAQRETAPAGEPAFAVNVPTPTAAMGGPDLENDLEIMAQDEGLRQAEGPDFGVDASGLLPADIIATAQTEAAQQTQDNAFAVVPPATTTGPDLTSTAQTKAAQQTQDNAFAVVPPATTTGPDLTSTAQTKAADSDAGVGGPLIPLATTTGPDLTSTAQKKTEDTGASTATLPPATTTGPDLTSTAQKKTEDTGASTATLPPATTTGPDLTATAQKKTGETTDENKSTLPNIPSLVDDIAQEEMAGKKTGDKSDLSVKELLALLGLLGAVGGGGGGGGTGTGAGTGKLQPIFSAKLPTPGEGGSLKVSGLKGPTKGAAGTFSARPVTDWYRFGMGPAMDIPAGTDLSGATSPYAGYGPGTLGQETFKAVSGIPQQPTGMYAGGSMGYSRGSSRESFAVEGPGTGRSDDIPAVLSDGEYVIDAETVALLGDGSSKAGAKRLDELRVNIRKHKGRNLAKGKFSVNAKRPEKYLSGGRA